MSRREALRRAAHQVLNLIYYSPADVLEIQVEEMILWRANRWFGHRSDHRRLPSDAFHPRNRPTLPEGVGGRTES
jgi:hypothetical protein